MINKILKDTGFAKTGKVDMVIPLYKLDLKSVERFWEEDVEDQLTFFDTSGMIHSEGWNNYSLYCHEDVKDLKDHEKNRVFKFRRKMLERVLMNEKTLAVEVVRKFKDIKEDALLELKRCECYRGTCDFIDNMKEIVSTFKLNYE